MTASAIRVLADLPHPTRDGRHVAAVVHRILGGVPYRRPAKPWLERLRDSVLDHIVRLLAAVTGPGLGAWIVFALLAAAIAFLAWRFGRGLTVDPSRSMAPAEDEVRPAAAWRIEAEAHERDGEWRLALRCRYRALVADLAGRGVLEEVPGRTAGEYRLELSGALPPAAPPFAGATELFERAWYGDAPTGATDAGRFRDLADRVLESAP